MKTKWKMLTLAAMLSATTTSASAADNGSGGAYDEDAYFAGSSNYAESLYDDKASTDKIGSARSVESLPAVYDDSYVADLNQAAMGVQDQAYETEYFDQEVEPVAYVGDEASYHSPGVGSGVPARTASHGTGYQTQSRASRMVRRPTQRTVLSSAQAWMTAEALLWFPEVRSTPPLVTTNATAGNDPTLDPAIVPNSVVAFGGNDAFGGDLQAGFRLDGGFMLSEDFGIGGRFWFLGEGEDTYANQGDGTTGSIGVPFFDTDPAVAAENSVRVAFNNGNPLVTDFIGSVNSRLTLDVYGAEGYGKLRLLEGKGYRSDFIGGFSHFGIDERFTQTVTAFESLDATLDPAIDNQFSFVDDLEAENRFYGGQIGFLTEVGHGAWKLSALTKVHLGDMEQTLINRGSRTFDAAGVTAPVTAPTPGGILTVGVNDETNNEFTFAPEVNLKMAYQMRPHVSFSVGYSFIMWNDVLMVGDNINRNVNFGALVPDGGGNYDNVVRPFDTGLKTDSFFVHGLDLGAVIEF
ncbi:BBP7 family outer membrane beta-barrel protein [Neorhodopirellula pilleata]|nr:BBP7 family outer membrane beta-barrel protein [Neorhodopirellula pilleata]